MVTVSMINTMSSTKFSERLTQANRRGKTTVTCRRYFRGSRTTELSTSPPPSTLSYVFGIPLECTHFLDDHLPNGLPITDDFSRKSLIYSLSLASSTLYFPK